jgi:drug/metabolite transporter (DMT)-like permease
VTDSSERPLLAIALRTAAMACIATMFMLAKVAGERGIALPEIMFWRQAGGLPLILGLLAFERRLHILRTRRIASHALRAVSGSIGMVCNIGAAMLLPLAEATTLGFTTPLFAVCMAALVLRQKVGPWRWTAVLLGFAGVLIIARPGQVPIPPLGLAAGLGAGFMVAIISFQIRDLSRTEAPLTCVFWFAAFGALFTGLLMPIYATGHTATEWGLLAGIAFTGTIGQFLLTTALKHGAVATVVVMDYTALIWSTLWGWAIWDNLPDAVTWLGAPLIVAAGLVITWREHKLSRPVTPPLSMKED